jgi:hypothetical protein
MTMRDPTVRALIITIGLRPGMTSNRLWRRLLAQITSPRFHIQFLAARIRSHLAPASALERTLTIGLYGAAGVTAWVAGLGTVLLLAWVVPLTVFFQIATTLRLVVKHVFPTPGGPRRGKEHHANLSYGIFLGEAVPPRGLDPARALSAWSRWIARTLLVHFPARYLVLTGDTVCHDYHHRHPRAPNWADYLFARQRDVADGHPGWPPYREVWSLVAATNLVFDSLTVADPAEFSSPTFGKTRDRDYFAAFDD